MPNNTLLVENAYNYILDQILNGTIKPGRPDPGRYYCRTVGNQQDTGAGSSESAVSEWFYP